MMKNSAYWTRIALVVGIFVLLNLLAAQVGFRLDFTADQRYTLSQATRVMLADLDEPVTVRAYFSEDLPPDVARARREFRDLLVEYASRSDGRIAYAFVDPNESEEAETEALQAGISPVMINVRERDQMTQRRAFLGAVVERGDAREVIPFLQPGAPMEYTLSTAVKKLTTVDRPTIGFLQGHGEPPLEAYQQAGPELNVSYTLEPVTLEPDSTVPYHIQTLAVVAPTDSIPPAELAQLDAFLDRGGNLLLALNRVTGDLRTASGSAVSTGLEGWLADKGVHVNAAFVIDAVSGSIAVRQQRGPFQFDTNVPFPYLPVISTFADHPITGGLEAVLFPFLSPLTFTGDSAVAYTPIAFTSARSGTEAPPLYFDIEREWSEADFPVENLPVAAVVEGPPGGAASARMVVIGDGDFGVNGVGQQAQPRNPDNISLLVNSIDWLSDDTGLIELRTRGVTSRPLDPLSPGAQASLKYLNFLLPILLVVLYGLWRAQQRRRLRRDRRVELAGTA